MILSVEEFGKEYMIVLEKEEKEISENDCERMPNIVSGIIHLKDIENLITHLEYFKNNDSLDRMDIKIGGEE
jgi:hypothetical protein